MILLLFGLIMKFFEISTSNRGCDLNCDRKYCNKKYDACSFCDGLLSFPSMYAEPFNVYEKNSGKLPLQHDMQREFKYLRKICEKEGKFELFNQFII